MIRAILFDLDGTLLDRVASLEVFVQEQYERLHPTFNSIPKARFVKRFVELDARGYVWKDKVYTQLLDEYGITTVTWQELLEDYMTAFSTCCRGFPGLHETLLELQHRGYLLSLVSNGRGAFQAANTRALGVERYFDSVHFSEWEGVAKPDPALFARATSALGVESHECAFVGDHPVNDVKAAMALGMRGFWKRTPDVIPPVHVDGVIGQLPELLAYFPDVRESNQPATSLK